MSEVITDVLKLDWLSFSFKCDVEALPEGKSEMDMFIAEFPGVVPLLQDAIILNRSRFYDNVLKIDKNVVISYCDVDKSGYGQGVNVSIPSSGLAVLFDYFGLPEDKDNLTDLFIYLRDHHCQLSRVDICYDDYTKSIMPDEYARWKLDKQMTTKFNKFQFVASDSSKGSTFYLGSRKTGKMLRIYDKDYESDGKIKSVRYEFELHSLYAREFADFIIEHGKEFRFDGYLLSWFDVKEKTGDSNRSRAPRLKKFCEFLDVIRSSIELAKTKNQIFIRTINPEDETDDTTVLPVHEDIVVIKIPHRYSSPTFDRKMEWLRGSTFKTLKMFVRAYGYEHLIDCLHDVELNEFDNYLLRNHVDDFYDKYRDQDKSVATDTDPVKGSDLEQ